jgi:dipeptidase E
MVTAPRESLSSAALLYHEETGEIKDDKALGYTNFQIRPHLNSKHFPKVTLPYLEKIAQKLPDTFYAIDDQTAIKVVDNEITIISEGQWKKFN